MHKGKLYIISLVLITICIFTTAVSCNLCGAPVEILLPGQETGTESTSTQQTGQQDTQQQQQPDEASQDSPADSPEEPQEGENSPPVIVEIEMAGYDVQLFEEEGTFDAIPIPTDDTIESVDVSIIATDVDADELQYRLYDDRGSEFEVTKIDNNRADAAWNMPTQTGPYVLTVEVSDGKGGVTQYPIEMTFVLGEVEFFEPEPGETSETTFSAEPTLSGHVSGDGNVFLSSESSGTPSLYVGDTVDEILLKGFLSFDVSSLAGKDVVEAKFNLSGSRVGEPNSLPTTFSVRHTDYGTSLDAGDFDSPSEGLFSRPLGYSDFSFSNDYLKDSLQGILDEGSRYFQISLEIPMYNNNDRADGFSFLLSNTSLEVTYR